MTRLEKYVETALWSTNDESDENTGGEPMDRNYSIDDIDAKSLEHLEKVVDEFYQKASKQIESLIELGYEDMPIEHDLWLTQNRHGAGFWDGDYPKQLGDELTKIAHSMGEIDLYVGDDGKIHAYGV